MENPSNIDKPTTSSSSFENKLFKNLIKNLDYIKNQQEALIIEIRSLKQHLPSRQQFELYIDLFKTKIKSEQLISVLEKQLKEIQEDLIKIKENIIEIHSTIKR